MIPNMLRPRLAFIAIREYAALSYLYYERDVSYVSDQEFDELCKWLLDNFDWVKPYDKSNYLDKGLLEAGTGFSLKVVGMTKRYALDLIGKRHETTNA